MDSIFSISRYRNAIFVNISYVRGSFNKVPDFFFVQAFKIIKIVYYCYTSYEMTDQFSGFQV